MNECKYRTCVVFGMFSLNPVDGPRVGIDWTTSQERATSFASHMILTGAMSKLNSRSRLTMTTTSLQFRRIAVSALAMCRRSATVFMVEPFTNDSGLNVGHV